MVLHKRPSRFIQPYAKDCLTLETPRIGIKELLMEFIKDFFSFLKTRKKYWLLPIFVLLGLLGVLIVLSSSSAVTPFIYTIF